MEKFSFAHCGTDVNVTAAKANFSFGVKSQKGIIFLYATINKRDKGVALVDIYKEMKNRYPNHVILGNSSFFMTRHENCKSPQIVPYGEDVINLYVEHGSFMIPPVLMRVIEAAAYRKWLEEKETFPPELEEKAPPLPMAEGTYLSDFMKVNGFNIY